MGRKGKVMGRVGSCIPSRQREAVDVVALGDMMVHLGGHLQSARRRLPGRSVNGGRRASGCTCATSCAWNSVSPPSTPPSVEPAASARYELSKAVRVPLSFGLADSLRMGGAQSTGSTTAPCASKEIVT